MTIITPKPDIKIGAGAASAQGNTFFDDYAAPHFAATVSVLAGMLAAFNTALLLGGVVLGFLGLWLVLLYVAHRRWEWRGGWQKFGAFCYISAALVIGVGGGIVTAVKAGYTQVGWTGTALFALGLVLDVMPRLGAFLNAVAVALVAAMVAGLVLLPVPREAGAWGNEETDSWNIEANVTDETGAPVSGAVVFCGSVLAWDATNPAALAAEYPGYTDATGRAVFSFHEDSRMKVAACAAYVLPHEDSPGMAASSGVGGTVIPGGDVTVEVQLDSRRPHTVQCDTVGREEQVRECQRQRLAEARR